MFNTIFFKISIIINNLFWWLWWNFNVLNIEFPLITKIILFLLLLFYFFSLLNLKKQQLNLYSTIKIFLRNTIFLSISIWAIFSVQTVNQANVITWNCYDYPYLSSQMNINNKNINYFDSLRLGIIQEKLQFWDNESKNMYCKIRNILVNAKYKQIKWSLTKKWENNLNKIIQKYKDWTITNKLQLEQQILADVYNNGYWLIWNNNWSYTSQFIYYNWKSYNIQWLNITPTFDNLITNVALLNYNSFNKYIPLWLFNNSNTNDKKMNIYMVNSPLNDANFIKKYNLWTLLNLKYKEVSFFQKLIWKKINIMNYLLYISFETKWIYKININNKEYYTATKLYEMLYNYDTKKILWTAETNWLVWVNIWFNNWNMYSQSNNKIYDLNLTSNSYYYHLNWNWMILPYNTNIFSSWILYIIFYILTLSSLIAILFLFYILIK